MKDLLFMRQTNFSVPVNAEANDIEFDGVGFETVEGPMRVFQAVRKALSTAIGSNPVLPLYGSVLPMVPGTVAADINDAIRKSIVKTLAFLIEVEESQDPSERIEGIADLTVNDVSGNPNAKMINLVVSLVDGSTLPPIIMGVGV